MNILCTILAVLSIWDYPARFPEHVRLRDQFLAALREGDTATMEETCRKGVKLLPDDPTWHYNLACSLAYFEKRQNEACDELEKAIDLGYRDVNQIVTDTDLRRLVGVPRFAELTEYAREVQTKPVMLGPMATVPATGVFGKSIRLGEQNLGWDFDLGAFVGQLKLATASAGGNTGDLYFNRDGMHSAIRPADFPGLTWVGFDQTGRDLRMDLNLPNVILPYPTFGNCSMAFTQSKFWRSLPRAMMTVSANRLPLMQRLYLSNQFWVYPSNADTAPVGTNGDVFASITPYWITTAGRSYSDLPYLKAALTASALLPTATKQAAVAQGLLAPTIQVLMRKALKGVTNETDYISAKAHPTALPPEGLDIRRLSASAAALKVAEIPPVVPIAVRMLPPKVQPPWPELTYATALAWAFVLRAPDPVRTFGIEAQGAEEYAFVKTHGEGVEVKIERTGTDSARITLHRQGMTPINRVDIAVFGRKAGTGWGAPSYLSIAYMDASAPYSDPVLTPLPQPKTPPPAAKGKPPAK